MSRTTVLIYAALFLSSLSIAEVAPANVFGESPSPREPAACPEANLHVLPVEEGKGRKPTAKEISTLKNSISDANLASFGGNNPGVWSEQAALLALLEGYKSTKDTWFIDWMDLSQWNQNIYRYCRSIRINRKIWTPLSFARELKWGPP